ncbi:hypothetical protein [Peredibacter starrii]|uniref:Lipoprotein n=1 Tax=Peredibacter starrii TaxID=28202 RepID=A0AAX4HJX6_9BACT|nr:hypothetical protein [Peredibacter starrii]WPU63545.1 hypothetical protein SOO65_12685 [Peredibacter starrii]
MSAKLSGLLCFALLVLMVGCASHEPNEATFDSRDEARAFR